MRILGIEKRERELPELEQVEMQEYATDRRRYGNSIVESKEGLPKELLEQDIVSVYQMLFFVDAEKINPYTGRRTFNNMTESYIVSGAYTKEFLDTVFAVKEVEIKDSDGNIIDTQMVYEQDDLAYKKMELEAMQNWKLKSLGSYVYSMFIEKLGGLEPEDLLKMEIINQALFSNDKKAKVQYTRIAVDVLGMKVKTLNITDNVWKKGGKEVIDAVAEASDMEFLK